MRIFHIHHNSVTESEQLSALESAGPPSQGFIWVACGRREFEVLQGQIQSMLHKVCGLQLVDLHITDLLNNQLPSHYDYTSQYDVLVFRRLAAGATHNETESPAESVNALPSRGGPPILRRIDTSPVGFAVLSGMLRMCGRACTARWRTGSTSAVCSTGSTRRMQLSTPCPTPISLVPRLCS